MLINQSINLAEKTEKHFQEIGFKDPYSSGSSLLHNLLALSFKDISIKTDQKFRARVWLLEQKINHLVLIVRRIRNLINLPLQEDSMETKNKHYIAIDIESFFYFAYSILNVVARLTPMFYNPKLEGVKSKSFESQRKWFINNSEKDKEFSKYLRTKISWFEDIREHRTQLTHYHSLIIFRSKEHVLTFGTRINKDGEIPNYPVMEYINEKTNNLLEFIVFYNRHFGKD